MTEFVLATYDWVPELPRGYVRDLRVRWALEEARMPYRVETTPFRDKTDAHLAHQPFAQVPWLTHDDTTLFESGAILLYLGERSGVLTPSDPQGRARTIEWLFAALNSVEMASLPWSLFQFQSLTGETPGWQFLDGWLNIHRLARLEPVLAQRDWLAGPFSIADIAMADVLRLIDRFDGLAPYSACRAYMQRAEARPAFQKALSDQTAHFAKAD
jgi:glutathione S-transferase